MLTLPPSYLPHQPPSLETRRISSSPPNNHRVTIGEINDRRRDLAALPGVHYGVQNMIKTLHDLPALRQWSLLSRHNQSARHQGFTQSLQDRLRYHVVGNPNADGASLGVQHSLWHLPSGRHDEGVLPRRRCLESAKDHVIQMHEPTQLIEVGAYQGEVVLIVQLTDLSNPVQALSVVQLAPKGETRICRVRDEPISAQEVDHTADGSRLRVVRVDVEISGHEWEPSAAALRICADRRCRLASGLTCLIAPTIQRLLSGAGK